MFTEVDLLGAFVPIVTLWLAASLVIFVVANSALTRAGAFRLVWHPPLARLALFALIFFGVQLLVLTRSGQ